LKSNEVDERIVNLNIYLILVGNDKVLNAQEKDAIAKKLSTIRGIASVDNKLEITH
jgi:hypothetical protein